MKVSKSRSAKRSPSDRERQRMLRRVISATTNKRYRQAIDIFERVQEKYALGENNLQTLALCYDHLARKKRKQQLRKAYLVKAERIYQNLLSNNSRNVNALIGMSRVCDIRGNYRTALRYALYAQRVQDRSLNAFQYVVGAIVGTFYEKLGDLVRAEQWLKKELCALGKDNLAANENLMRFYVRHGMYRKALPFALRTEWLMKREFSKALYRGSGIRESRYVRDSINIIKEVRMRMEKMQ